MSDRSPEARLLLERAEETLRLMVKLSLVPGTAPAGRQRFSVSGEVVSVR
jgi:hypothetical protein